MLRFVLVLFAAGMGCSSGTVSSAGGSLKSAADTTIKGRGRPLIASEKALLRRLYPVEVPVDVDRIRVYSGGAIKTFLDRGATTFGFDVHFKPERFHDDFTQDERGRLLAHESCHVWQNQYAAATGYSLYTMMREHLDYEDPYAYDPPRDDSVDFNDYRFEQQCRLVEKYLALRGQDTDEARIVTAVVERGFRSAIGATGSPPSMAEDLLDLRRALNAAKKAAQGVVGTDDSKSAAKVRKATRAEQLQGLLTAWLAAGMIQGS
jgi:hypothetical protein